MKIFSRYIYLAHAYVVTCVLSIAGTVHAATVELKSGDTLSGKIQQLNGEFLSLNSAVAERPLEIHSSAVKRILFSDQTDIKQTHGELLTLITGDIIPCKVLSLDNHHLKISTQFAGDFSIPKQQLEAIQFGMQHQKIIFSGDQPASEWTSMKGKWTRPKGTAYRCSGKGNLVQKLALTENIRVSYMLSWSNTPQFMFRFCAENDSDITRQDCYEFVFNRGGMQLRRLESDNHDGAPLASIPLKPSAFPSKKVKMDFVIDRKNQEITLRIDDAVIGKFPDQLGVAPGNHIIFSSRSDKNDFTISDILITESKADSLDRHRESVITIKSDVLVTSRGDKVSGTVLGMKSTGARRILQLMQLNDTDPINIPEKRISSIHFANQDAPEQDKQKGEYSILLHGGGKLQMNTLAINGDSLTLTHSILGKITLPSSALLQISKASAEK